MEYTGTFKSLKYNEMYIDRPLMWLYMYVTITKCDQERVLLKFVDLGVDVNVDFTTKVTHTYIAFYEVAQVHP